MLTAPLQKPLLAIALLLGLATSLAARAAEPEPGAAICPALPRPAVMPREAVPEQLESPDWRWRYDTLEAELAKRDHSHAKLVFIGDSITQYFDPGLFQQFYGHRAPLNLGLWGDFTQGVLWRVFSGPAGSQGEWGNLAPTLAVVLIGTNNTQWGGKPEDVALGVAEIVRRIQTRSPRTKVLLIGLLPRGATAAEPLRAVNTAVNGYIARCADDKTIFYIDVGRLLLDAEGALSDQISFDHLHPTAIGYAIIATALEPMIHRILRN